METRRAMAGVAGATKAEDADDAKLAEALATTPEAYRETIGKILFSESELQNRIRELAAQISRDYEGKNIVVVGLLKGAFMALADVARRLTVPNKVDFMVASSYGSGTKSSGVIKLKKDIDIDPLGQHILIVEDLVDTGNTLAWIKNYLLSKQPASVKICCVLDKVSRRTAEVEVDYVGFECPDEFVVGFGMDFAGDYRTLPYVGVLKPECYLNSQ